MIRIPVTETVIEKVHVPEELLRECPGPELDELQTNGDIEAALIASTVALQTCNQDKREIRLWSEKE